MESSGWCFHSLEASFSLSPPRHEHEEERNKWNECTKVILIPDNKLDRCQFRESDLILFSYIWFDAVKRKKQKMNLYLGSWAWVCYLLPSLPMGPKMNVRFPCLQGIQSTSLINYWGFRVVVFVTTTCDDWWDEAIFIHSYHCMKWWRHVIPSLRLYDQIHGSHARSCGYIGVHWLRSLLLQFAKISGQW